MRAQFPAGPLAITPENLTTGRCLRKTDYVMLSSDFCSPLCTHASLDRLCSDELGQGMRGHRERLDAVVAPISTLSATLVHASMLVAL